MSESSSDTESSCGWTVISNEGSDIETLGPDLVVDYDPEDSVGASAPEHPASSREEDAEEAEQSCLDVTIKEDESAQEAEPGRQARKEVGLEDPVNLCSSSDHSDIVTLGDCREAELGVWEEPVVREDQDKGNEELYMGTSSSSQYTFSAVETIFPADHSARRSSSSTSSEGEDDETKVGTGPATVRKRRLRRNTTGSDPEEQNEKEEDGDDGHEEVEEAEEQREARIQQQQQKSRTMNTCFLLALVIAASMGFSHYYSTVQIWERQHKAPEFICGGDLMYDLEENQDSVMGFMDEITNENQHLRAREAELKTQRQDLYTQLQQAKSEMDSRQKHFASENRALKNTLEREEASLLALKDKLGHLQAQIRELEEKGAGADLILSENQRLKDQLLEEKQKIQSYLSQKEALMAEAQLLRKELDNERKVTVKLREELEELSQRDTGMQGEDEIDTETEGLQARLRELEKKLSFEQQRSDLWERLYVESKDDRAKGDTQAKTRKSKEGMIGKVKETFDAVKNSTKEFVHHHKEQLKKAQEAVKENLRKFSDSVKSTFRHLKDSTSNVFEKIRRPQDRRFNEKKDPKSEEQAFQQESFKGQQDKRSEEEHWQHHRPLHKHSRKSTLDSSFHADCNTRKPGAPKQQRTMGCKSVPTGCTGVFDCAYRESMSLFNKAMEPIRADEFQQLLRSYLQQEVVHFRHWRELDNFISRFFQNGFFIHDQMLFTDFVSGVEDYLVEMNEYQDENEDVFEDLDDYIYKYFFGVTNSDQNGHNGPSRWLYFEFSQKHCDWEGTC
ncbi:cell cycle progression protein 1 isoform X2 [Tachysurus vachellii]|uniref:cell cycle progression protein 1 isoform X2 n=1 Tax=Tachysurus vachellii TaxID=175792 RepID=UPI00296AAEFF|nr:cell cycle progression protein 1 isoform X2 [Tachysurus vachellii]XP_060734378.1 cell cycle progression protein 1 isoform X2 [Tachysurus vachellii]